MRSAAYNRSNSGNDSSDCDTFNRTTDSVGEQNPEKCSSDVGTFKLADEAHMGGLNSLMVAADIVRSVTNNNYKLNADQSTEDEGKITNHTIMKLTEHSIINKLIIIINLLLILMLKPIVLPTKMNYIVY